MSTFVQSDTQSAPDSSPSSGHAGTGESGTGDASSEESALLDRARTGDSEAVAAILKRYEGPLLRYSRRMCGHPEDAEDVLQDSLLSAVRNLDGFRGDAKLSTWLFTIVRSFCLKKRRRSKFAPKHMESLDATTVVADTTPEPESAVAGREVQQALGDAIAALPADNREIVLLRDVEGLSATEVAAVVDMTESQVKSRLHRARVAIRKHVTDRMSRQELGLGRDPVEPAQTDAPCPDIAAAFSRMLEEDINAETCERLQAHVDGCARCQQVCDGMKRTLAVCQALPTPAVPAPVQEQVRAAIRAELERGTATNTASGTP